MTRICAIHARYVRGVVLTRATTLSSVAVTALLVLTSGAPDVLAKRPTKTALDRYVATPDPAYKYTLISSQPADGYTIDLIEMTSQRWLTEREVDRPLWTHWLTVIRPTKVAHQTALMFVTGGNNGGKPPDRPNPLLTDIAVTTQSVVAELRMVPNQPLVFADEGKPRREDEMIAYSWDKFLRTGDERWPARLPMTKAVVRAMDTVTSYCGTDRCGAGVERFVVAGASKRGWTTWTTAAVDARVVAIIPMVIDLLNLEPSFEHHWRAYGFWSPAIKDYEALQIMRWMKTPQYRALREIEDPYEYRARLTLPKFLINAAGDQFFLPDSSRFYFNDLQGEKYIRYVPNTDHSLRDTDAGESLAAFYAMILTNTPRPVFTWTIAKDGTIRVRTKTTPLSVTLWRAESPDARDFRLETIGKAYKAKSLSAVGATGTNNTNFEYDAPAVKPAKGWSASFIEVRFPSRTKYPLVFTTGVAITPDSLPYGRPRSVATASRHSPLDTAAPTR
jgi:PhoPQ-activated pathogenicity-related protein